MRDAEVLARAKRLAPRRYEPKSVLGTGAMGHVVRAWDDQLQREVALKLIIDRGPAAEEARRRFMREARALAALDDERLVRIFDVDADRGLLVLELVDGASLRDVMNAEHTIDLTRARQIAMDVLDGLSAVHAANLVHRDVKPGNILLDATGRAKLADFGIAYVESDERTRTGTALGTPGYMAPEQLRGRSVDARADLYALAATLFEAVTGAGLHDEERSTKDVRRAVLMATKDPSFADALARAAKPQAERRFASATDFRAALVAKKVVARTKVWGLVAAALLVGALSLLWVTLDRSSTGSTNRGPVGLGSVGAPGPRPNDPEAAPIELSGADFEEDLAAAIDLLEGHEIVEAVIRLEKASRSKPDAPEPHYHLAIARWWMGSPRADVERHVARALDVGQTEQRRTFLNGLRLLIAPDYPRAVAYFEKAHQLHSADRAIAYGLFEAYFHGGRPADATRIYREIVAQYPQFSLGMMHAFSYALVSRDADTAAWVFERTAARADPTLLVWKPRWQLANGRPNDAIAQLRDLDGTVSDPILRRARIEAYAAAQRFDEAISMFDVSDHPSERLLRSSLLLAANREVEANEERHRSIVAGRAESPGPPVFDLWLLLVQLDAARGDPKLVAKSRPLLLGVVEANGHHADPRFMMVEVLASSVRHDEERLVELSASNHPEVTSAARAVLAEREGRNEEAAELWLVAASHSSDGRYLVAAHHHAALAYRRAGRKAEARAACREVVAPRVLSIDWGALVRSCQAR